MTASALPPLLRFPQGLDWNALGVGTLPPPIKPKPREIHADLPRELKDEFSAWAKKDVPPEVRSPAHARPPRNHLVTTA